MSSVTGEETPYQKAANKAVSLLQSDQAEAVTLCFQPSLDTQQSVRFTRLIGVLVHSDLTPYQFFYVNHEGRGALRRVYPLRVFFGKTKHHPDPTWLMEAYDIEKDAIRFFDMKQMSTMSISESTT